MDFRMMAAVPLTSLNLSEVKETFTQYKKYLGGGEDENRLLTTATISWCVLHAMLEVLEDKPSVDPTGFLYEGLSDLKDEIYLDVGMYLMKAWDLNVGDASKTFMGVMEKAYRDMFKRPMRELKSR